MHLGCDGTSTQQICRGKKAAVSVTSRVTWLHEEAAAWRQPRWEALQRAQSRKQARAAKQNSNTALNKKGKPITSHSAALS